MRYRIFFKTSYHYDFASQRGAVLEGIASRSTEDAEGDIIRSFDEESVEYLARWGKLNFDHKQTTIGHVLEARVLPTDLARKELDALAKSFEPLDEEDNVLLLKGQLFPLRANSHPDLQEVYHLISHQASIGFSIEGRPGEMRKSKRLAKNGRLKECRVISGLKLHPRVAVTPTPVHPDATVVIVKSFSRPQITSQNVAVKKCSVCAYIFWTPDSGYCPRCGTIIL